MKNYNNGKQVSTYKPIGYEKVEVFYMDGTSEVMTKQYFKQVCR